MKEEVFVESAASRPPSLLRRVSWGAIFAGLLVTVVVQLMLTLLGVGIGAATLNPLQEQNPAEGLAMGSAIWLIVSALISVFIGSCIAGRLSGAPRRADGLLHGIVTWSAATVLTILFLVSALGTLLGGTGVLLSRAMGTAIGAAQRSGGLDQNALAALEQKMKGAVSEPEPRLTPTGREDASRPPGDLAALAKNNKELAAALASMEAKGGASQAPAERDKVMKLLTDSENLEPARAEQLVAQWDTQAQQSRQQVEQKVRETGQVAAEGTAKAALWGFAALLLELVIAAWGGWAGASSLARTRRVEHLPAAS